MAAMSVCGQWFVCCSDKKLIAISTEHTREPFVFDCSTAEKKPKNMEADGRGGGPAETGNDKILALAVSPSGNLAALTDDSKRLVLFRTEPSWRQVSTRWVTRKCTSLAFTHAGDALLAADKSGDVYSFSVADPQKIGELKLGHLSTLLSMAVTPDDRYVITADRDEKIRVSRLASPYDIRSFCLGHREFVGALAVVPSVHPSRWLLSGSGDGTVKLWDYESGRELQSWDLEALRETSPSTGTEQGRKKRYVVSGIACSPDGHHVAVQCERLPTVQFFRIDQRAEEERIMVVCGRVKLPHSPLHMSFDPEGRLWVLLDDRKEPLQIYTHHTQEDRWECDPESSSKLNRVADCLKPHREALQAGAEAESFQHLYKVNFNNRASYVQRKQRRLEQQKSHPGKKRRAETADGASSNEVKKFKPVSQAARFRMLL